jgi:hypothetical protein
MRGLFGNFLTTFSQRTNTFDRDYQVYCTPVAALARNELVALASA